MNHTTVFIILDAQRHDYVNARTMPFLHGLAQESRRSSMESPPGFAQRTVMFTGRYPDTSGNFAAFVYDPQRSPFQWVRRLGPAAKIIQPRRALYPTRMAVQKVTKWTSGAYHTDPAWIPPKFMPFFRPCEDMRPIVDAGALGATSIFDLLREEGMPFRYLAHPISGDDAKVRAHLARDLRAGIPNAFYAAQLSAPDQDGHKYGPHSDKFQTGTLRLLDERLSNIHAALDAGYDSWDLVLVGDHGMGPVHRRVNILDALAQTHAKPAEDYVVFVNSTLCAFWYLTPHGKRAVEDAVAQIPGTRLISDEERAKRRIPTDRRWGDALLAADPGVLFWPDYFHVEDSTILGMHGYLDKTEEGQGMAILASSRRTPEPQDVGLRPLVDVFPTLCDILGVRTPSGQEGTSLLQPATHKPSPPVPLLTIPGRT